MSLFLPFFNFKKVRCCFDTYVTMPPQATIQDYCTAYASLAIYKQYHFESISIRIALYHLKEYCKNEKWYQLLSHSLLDSNAINVYNVLSSIIRKYHYFDQQCLKKIMNNIYMEKELKSPPSPEETKGKEEESKSESEQEEEALFSKDPSYSAVSFYHIDSTINKDPFYQSMVQSCTAFTRSSMLSCYSLINLEISSVMNQQHSFIQFETSLYQLVKPYYFAQNSFVISPISNTISNRPMILLLSLLSTIQNIPLPSLLIPSMMDYICSILTQSPKTTRSISLAIYFTQLLQNWAKRILQCQATLSNPKPMDSDNEEDSFYEGYLMSNTTVDVSIVDCLQKNLRTIFTMIGQNLFLKQSSIEFDMLPIHICPQCPSLRAPLAF